MAKLPNSSGSSSGENEERRLRAYCERIKERGQQPTRGKLTLGSAQAAKTRRDSLERGLLSQSHAMAVRFAGTTITLGKKKDGDDPDTGALIKLVSKIYDLADEFRIALKTVLDGTTIVQTAWWGAELRFTTVASVALQKLIVRLPELGLVLGLLTASPHAALISIVVGASGLPLAQRLKARTNAKGVGATIYFYAIPFIDELA